MFNKCKLHLITLLSLNNIIIATLYILNFQRRSCSIYELKKGTISLKTFLKTLRYFKQAKTVHLTTMVYENEHDNDAVSN